MLSSGGTGATIVSCIEVVWLEENMTSTMVWLICNSIAKVSVLELKALVHICANACVKVWIVKGDFEARYPVMILPDFNLGKLASMIRAFMRC